MAVGGFFFFNDTATTEIYTLSLHDALPICSSSPCSRSSACCCSSSRCSSACSPTWAASCRRRPGSSRSEEHTSELQSRQYLVCRLLLEKKKTGPSAVCVAAHFTPLFSHLYL